MRASVLRLCRRIRTAHVTVSQNCLYVVASWFANNCRGKRTLQRILQWGDFFRPYGQYCFYKNPVLFGSITDSNLRSHMILNRGIHKFFTWNRSFFTTYTRTYTRSTQWITLIHQWINKTKSIMFALKYSYSSLILVSWAQIRGRKTNKRSCDGKIWFIRVMMCQEEVKKRVTM